MDGSGPHLMLDGYGCARAKLEDLSLVYRTLDELPARLDMTKIMPPYVFRYRGVKPEDWGLSGFVLIAESHISIHTFPEKQFVSVDIFSRKTFDPEFASGYLKSAFGMSKVESRVLERGAARMARAERRRLARRGSSAPLHQA